MQEQTGEIRELTTEEHDALVKEERDKIEKTLQGFTALTEEEFIEMNTLPVEERPSDLSSMRYFAKIDVKDLSLTTMEEIYTDGFKAARKIYEK